ncbi:MAG: hypothetical protein ACTHL8_09940 [Burkholderiaceae bacterium]
MKWLIARLAEPSTWAGLGVFATQIIPAIQTHNTGAIVATVLGAVSAIVPEKSGA